MAMRRVSLFLADDLIQGLKLLKKRDGIAEAESIRRAIAAYLPKKGVKAKKKGPK